MLTIEFGKNLVTMRFEWRPPVVYLDVAPLCQVAEARAFASRFLDAMARRGTFALSRTHLVELSRLQRGRSRRALWRFLYGIGSSVMPIDPNPRHVAHRQCAGAMSEREAAVDVGLALTAIGTDGTICGGPVGMDRYLAMAVRDRRSLRRYSERMKDPKTGPQAELTALAHGLSASGQDDVPFTASLRMSKQLLAQIGQARLGIKPNDGADFFHAVVPAVVGDLIVLDKTWAHYAARVPSPPRLAAVFSGKKGQIERFLDAFERWEPPPGVK